MQEYKVTVIVPVYNPGEFLRPCIESILSQTLKEIEIVAVDDGSTDGSSEVLQEYAERNKDFFVVKNPNKNGVKAARSCGLRNAHGEYIGWVDADDFVAPDMFKKLYESAKEKDAELAFCNYDFVPDQNNRAKWVQPYYGRKDWKFLERNTVFWTTIMKQSFINGLDFANLVDEVSEYAKLALLINAQTIIYLDEPLYYHRVGHESTSHKNVKGRLDFYLQGVSSTRKLKEKILKGSGFEKELSEYFDYRLIYKLLLVALVAAYNNDKVAYDEATAELNRNKYEENKYTKTILDFNYGKVKSLVIRKIIPANYKIARMVSKISL